MDTEQLTLQLNIQYQKSEQLLTLLTEENKALVERDIDKIETLARDKQKILSELATADQQIKQLVTSINELPAELMKLKNVIVDNITKGQLQNDINGKAIALGINSLERLQTSLIRKRAGNSMTYNQKGKTRGGGIRGSYISA
ncbi:MAG: flagellar protein FlgN [Gammaproteobacteria bacterium]|nr:flagellar protein FlgN [Gammaproteobacteria bacterium]